MADTTVSNIDEGKSNLIKKTSNAIEKFRKEHMLLIVSAYVPTFLKF